MEMKTINDMLETNILKKSSQFWGGVSRGASLRFGCPKRHPDDLLAKTGSHTTLVVPYAENTFGQLKD